MPGEQGSAAILQLRRTIDRIHAAFGCRRLLTIS
jgi:hypothetical protein